VSSTDVPWRVSTSPRAINTSGFESPVFVAGRKLWPPALSCRSGKPEKREP
jgi:hypothetical protein